MNMITPNSVLAREAAIDRRLDELLAKRVAGGWTRDETAEYQKLAAARANSMKAYRRPSRTSVMHASA